jgi:hypothetical protein
MGILWKSHKTSQGTENYICFCTCIFILLHYKHNHYFQYSSHKISIIVILCLKNGDRHLLGRVPTNRIKLCPITLTESGGTLTEWVCFLHSLNAAQVQTSKEMDNPKPLVLHTVMLRRRLCQKRQTCERTQQTWRLEFRIFCHLHPDLLKVQDKFYSFFRMNIKQFYHVIGGLFLHSQSEVFKIACDHLPKESTFTYTSECKQ